MSTMPFNIQPPSGSGKLKLYDDTTLCDALLNVDYKAHKIQVTTVPVKIGIMKRKAQTGGCLVIYQSGGSVRVMYRIGKR